MSSFRLDKNNNIVTGADINIVDDNAALAQDIKNALMMWRGEYPFDVTDGIDYPSFFASQDKQTLLSEIQKRISADIRVAAADIDISKNGKSLAITITTTSNQEVSFELG